jgi:hypothetical protein
MDQRNGKRPAAGSAERAGNTSETDDDSANLPPSPAPRKAGFSERSFDSWILCVPHDLVRMRLAARPGNPRAIAMTQTLNAWLEAAGIAKFGVAQRCINFDCSAEFCAGAPKPAAFVILTSDAQQAALVSGVCADCARRYHGMDGLKTLAFRPWSKAWPQHRVVLEEARR